MTYRALPLGLLLALVAHAADPIEVIDEEALKPAFEEFWTRLEQTRKGTLKIEDLVQYYQQQALATGTPKERAIRTYIYGFLLLRTVPNREKDAKREIERAHDLAPGLLPAYSDLAAIAEKAGDRAEAERLLRRAVGIDPKYVRATIQLGQIAQRAGELERAKAIYEGSLDIKPTVDAMSMLVVVNTALFLKCYDDREKEKLAKQALAAADAVVTLEPDDRLRLAKAEVYANLGRVRAAIDYLERLYAGGTLKPEIQLELLRMLRALYQSQGDVAGVKVTVERFLKCEALRPEERAQVADRLKDIEGMGQHAIVKWQVEDAIRRLHNEGLGVEERQAVQRRLQDFIISSPAMDIEELRPLVFRVWCECFRVLVDSPPELTLTQLRWLRNSRPPARLMGVLVHFVYPNGKTEEVREEGVRTVAALGGAAAIPAIYFSLQDDSGRVVRECDSQLSVLCERRSPLGGGIEPFTAEERKQALRAWTKYFHSEEGAERLARGFASLGDVILKVKPESASRPMIDHAAHVLLDDDVPWPAWAASYGFLVRYWGKEFRPVDRRGKAVEPFEREHVVKAFKAEYSGAVPEPAPASVGKTGMAKGK